MVGHRAFASVRDAPAPPLTSVTKIARYQMRRVKWTKEGRNWLPMVSTQGISREYPITFQGQKRSISRIQPQGILLESPVTLKDCKDLEITQPVTSAHPELMHQCLIAEWSKLWKRDPCHEPANYWDDFNPFLRCINDCPTCEFQPLTPDRWLANLKGVKKNSARGADGFSTFELQLVHGPLLHFLLDILSTIEKGAKWPDLWTQARVVVLSKGFEPKSPLDIRPISILPKIYRTWSRLRSLEVLRHIGSILPPQVAATAGGISADSLAAYTATVVEDAFWNREDKCGVVIDIIKCYNMIPWTPSAVLLEKLKIPHQYITGLMSLLKNIRRSFDIQGNCSQFFNATTGIAEGCALSVSLMAVYSLLTYKVFLAMHPGIQPLCYADNWGLIANAPSQIKPAIFTLSKIVNSLRMAISFPKSWVWATKLSWKNSLNNIQVDGHTFPYKTHAVDLGCEINYNRRKLITAGKKRIEKATRVLKRIQKIKIPVQFKRKMIHSCGFGTMAYGSELQHIPCAEWKTIRTATLAAMHRKQASASPWIGTMFNPCPVDPQLKGVIRAGLFWRRFFRNFPSLKAGFLDRIVNSLAGPGPAVSLAVSLGKTFRAIGWAPLPDGFLQHTLGFQFNWVACSVTFLKYWLRVLWTTHAAHKAQSRKDFDISSVDEYLMMKVLNKFPSDQKQLLVTHFTGAACTGNMYAKFNPNVHPECSLCGVIDDREHRIFNCKKYEIQRFNAKPLFKWLTKQSAATKLLGLVPLDLTFSKVLWENQLEWPENVIPLVDLEIAHVFVDGSAFHQDLKICCISAGAAVKCQPFQTDHTKIFASPVPGVDHSAYRGEVFAIWGALLSCYRVHLYIDCEAALVMLKYLCDCHSCNITPKIQDHHDLWERVWVQIRSRPPCIIDATKTKAHTDVESIDDPFLKWQAMANNTVDAYAKQALLDWNPTFAKASSHYAISAEKQEFLIEYCNFVKHMASKVTDSPIKIQPDAIIDFTTRIPVGPFFVHNVPQACPENWPFGDFFGIG